MTRNAQMQIDQAVADGRPATTQVVTLDGVEYAPEHYAERHSAHWHGERNDAWAQPIRVIALHAPHGTDPRGCPEHEGRNSNAQGRRRR